VVATVPGDGSLNVSAAAKSPSTFRPGQEQASFPLLGNCMPAILLKSTLVICYFYAGGHNMKLL
jgi:hypothetical protein